jgi:hypothetical protein
MSTLFMSGLFATIYWGGWNIPIINVIIGLFGGTPIDLNVIEFGRLIGLVIYFVKTFVIYFVFIWIRGTLPRLRVDQMLNFNWKFMVPLTITLVLAVAVLDKLIPVGVNELTRGGIHLVSNLVIGFVTLEILRRRGRQNRLAQEAQRQTAPDIAAAD